MYVQYKPMWYLCSTNLTMNNITHSQETKFGEWWQYTRHQYNRASSDRATRVSQQSEENNSWAMETIVAPNSARLDQNFRCCHRQCLATAVQLTIASQTTFFSTNSLPGGYPPTISHHLKTVRWWGVKEESNIWMAKRIQPSTVQHVFKLGQCFALTQLRT